MLTAFEGNHKENFLKAVKDINTVLNDFYKSDKDYTKLASLIMKKGIDSYLADLLSLVCKSPLHIKNPLRMENHYKLGIRNFSRIYNQVIDRTFFNMSFFNEKEEKDQFHFFSSKTLEKIEQSFKMGMPVGYGYHSGKFTKTKGGNHGSTITARRWNEQKEVCEFKIRNSWGKNCAYKEDIECVREEGAFLNF